MFYYKCGQMLVRANREQHVNGYVEITEEEYNRLHEEKLNKKKKEGAK